MRAREAIEDDARMQRFHPMMLTIEVLLDLRELEIARDKRIAEDDFAGVARAMFERAEQLLSPGPTPEQEREAHPLPMPPYMLPSDFEMPRNPSDILAEISSLVQTALESNAQFQQQALELLTGIHHQLSVAPEQVSL